MERIEDRRAHQRGSGDVQDSGSDPRQEQTPPVRRLRADAESLDQRVGRTAQRTEGESLGRRGQSLCVKPDSERFENFFDQWNKNSEIGECNADHARVEEIGQEKGYGLFRLGADLNDLPGKPLKIASNIWLEHQKCDYRKQDREQCKRLDKNEEERRKRHTQPKDIPGSPACP